MSHLYIVCYREEWTGGDVQRLQRHGGHTVFTGGQFSSTNTKINIIVVVIMLLYFYYPDFFHCHTSKSKNSVKNSNLVGTCMLIGNVLLLVIHTSTVWLCVTCIRSQSTLGGEDVQMSEIHVILIFWHLLHMHAHPSSVFRRLYWRFHKRNRLKLVWYNVFLNTDFSQSGFSVLPNSWFCAQIT